jgi:cation:H+ antiporter
LSDGLLVVAFVVAAAVSLATSYALVTRLERVGARLGLTEALLGMLAALAADAPEITAAVTALADHQAQIGAGVLIGSNVFNLAALLGLAAVAGGRIELHRRVIVFEGTVAMFLAVVCFAVVVGGPGPGIGLLAAAAAMIPYLLISGSSRERLAQIGLPPRWTRWLSDAVAEEEIELEPAIHPQPGGGRVAVVVGASIAMERSASTLGTRHGVADIVIGGLILAGVTSLPNAVAALYLARRGRGAATLSVALNSNALNVTVGLLAPAIIVGLGPPSGEATLVAAWYLGLTALSLGCAYGARGLRRTHGALIIVCYLAFVAAVLATS